MSLFQVALIRKPTKKEGEDGKLEELITGPDTIVARDEKGAVMAAIMANKDKIGTDADRVEVVVRPF